jgi:hypothetical protein
MGTLGGKLLFAASFMSDRPSDKADMRNVLIFSFQVILQRPNHLEKEFRLTNLEELKTSILRLDGWVR